jgi:hypothetical protein
MNLRHAAALALLGWYLMVAPLADSRTVDLDAPLTKWDIFRSFDSAAQCEKTPLDHGGPRLSLRVGRNRHLAVNE